jgi:uncharacterized RmlC-like cupin family protein
MRYAFAAILVMATTAALAQPAATGGVLVVPKTDILKRVDVPPARPGAPVSTIVTSTPGFITMFAHRTAATAAPEQHAHWLDIMVMQKGEITLIYGGTLSGNTVDEKGESHGGTITGGTTVVLHAGDYLEIPAGVPHQMDNAKGDFHYFVAKVRA